MTSCTGSTPGSEKIEPIATRTKLTVILHADVVGSTALVQKDERVAHERIQDTFQRFSETIAAYGGIAHELRGDALVAGFERASDAVCAALAFQAANRQYNEDLSADMRPEIRVGIALGEVIIADHTVTGPGVILAQRLEQLASPGEVVVQGAVNDTVPRRLPFDYEALGDQILKGFDEPVRAHSVRLSARETVPAPDPRSPSVEGRAGHRKRQWITGGVIALLIIVVGLAWWRPWKPELESALMERTAFSLPDKPSIAVLPFTNMSDDPNQEYFVDEMSDDLITDLSKISGLFVIARNSSFTYKGKAVDVKRVSRELGVKYILESSVRRVGDQVRINAQLIDATTGGHLWAERYDGAMRNVFSLQDEITSKIVAALAVQLTADEEVRQSQNQTDNPQAYEAFLRGWDHYRRDTTEHYKKAMEYFQQASDLDPEYGRAYAAMASIYWKSFTDFGMEQYDNAAKLLERARELNPEDWASNDPSEARYCLPCQVLLSTYGHLARTADADSLLAYIRSYFAEFTVSYTAQEWPYKKAEDAERLNEGLRKVGVPE